MPQLLNTSLTSAQARIFAVCGLGAILGLVICANGWASETPLKACGYSDAAPMRERLSKLSGVKKLVENKRRGVDTTAPATLESWNALQQEIAQYFAALQLVGGSTSTKATLFNDQSDPFCGASVAPVGACLDQVFAAHQRIHAHSCEIGNWNWRKPWSLAAMLEEEATALQAEIDFLKNQPGCAGPRQCPQFQLVVQVITTSSITTGGLVERSGRSLNGAQGIDVPLVLQADGSYTGTGSGMDSGAAAGASAAIGVSSQFGHRQSIQALGTLIPGNCTGQPCQSDIMHLVLSGMAAPQAVQAQVRGAVNRDLSQISPGGAATLVFDVPAYVGGSAQKTWLAMGIVNSTMTVTLQQASHGSPGIPNLPDGSSILAAQRQCREDASGAP